LYYERDGKQILIAYMKLAQIQELKVSPVPRQASASKAFKGLAWNGRGDACKNYTPFLLDLGEKNNQKCDIPYVL
jgi:hypothetical protein